MSDAILSEDDLRRYELLLRQLQDEVETLYTGLAENCEPVAPDASLGRLTRTDAMQDQQMALHHRRQLELQQTRIQTALQRIEAGAYGKCVLCKETIDKGRLDIMPESPLCVGCLESRAQQDAPDKA